MVRVLAIIGVLLVHATANAAVGMGASSLHPFYILLNRFGKVGTPTFIFLSSLVLFFNYYHRPLNSQLVKRFYGRRLKLIVAPYLVWSLIYYLNVVYILNGGFHGFWSTFSWQQLLMKILTGKAYFHLYFVIISIQFYMLFPGVLYLTKRFPQMHRHVLWLAPLLHWGFYALNRYVIQIHDTSSLFTSYLAFYLYGAYAGIYYQQFVDWLRQGRFSVITRKMPVSVLLLSLWIISGLGYSYIYLLAFGRNIWYDGFWYLLGWFFYTLFSAVALHYLALLLQKYLSTARKKLLINLGDVSFGIYLVHPLLLWIWQKLTVTGNPLLYHLFVAGGFVFIFIGSWAIVSLVQRTLPFAWVLFGEPRKSGNRKKNYYSGGRNSAVNSERLINKN